MWDSETLWEVMCVMLHNMIVEDECDGSAHTNDFEKPENMFSSRNKMQSML